MCLLHAHRVASIIYVVSFRADRFPVQGPAPMLRNKRPSEHVVFRFLLCGYGARISFAQKLVVLFLIAAAVFTMLVNVSWWASRVASPSGGSAKDNEILRNHHDTRWAGDAGPTSRDPTSIGLHGLIEKQEKEAQAQAQDATDDGGTDRDTETDTEVAQQPPKTPKIPGKSPATNDPKTPKSPKPPGSGLGKRPVDPVSGRPRPPTQTPNPNPRPNLPKTPKTPKMPGGKLPRTRTRPGQPGSPVTGPRRPTPTNPKTPGGISPISRPNSPNSNLDKDIHALWRKAPETRCDLQFGNSFLEKTTLCSEPDGE